MSERSPDSLPKGMGLTPFDPKFRDQPYEVLKVAARAGAGPARRPVQSLVSHALRRRAADPAGQGHELRPAQGQSRVVHRENYGAGGHDSGQLDCGVDVVHGRSGSPPRARAGQQGLHPQGCRSAASARARDRDRAARKDRRRRVRPDDSVRRRVAGHRDRGDARHRSGRSRLLQALVGGQRRGILQSVPHGAAERSGNTGAAGAQCTISSE